MIHVFIINSKAGRSKFAAELRSHLAYRTDIDYYILHTRKRHAEKQLVRDILNLFEGEKIRIYSCGGSGTFCNILNGVKDLDSVELAFYPKGLTNDFLKAFGEKEALFKSIDALIDGDVIKIDYIKTNHGVCLNTFSIGLDSVLVKKKDDFRSSSIFGNSAPYTLGFLYSVFMSKADDYEVELDDKRLVGKFSEIFFGNGGCIGGTLWFEMQPDYRDGLGYYSIFDEKKGLQMLPILNTLAKKRTEQVKQLSDCGYSKTISIRRRDGMSFRMDFDGELQPGFPEWKAEIVHEGISFVVPKGVVNE